MPGRRNPNLTPASVNMTDADRAVHATLDARLCRCSHTFGRHDLLFRNGLCNDCQECRGWRALS